MKRQYPVALMATVGAGLLLGVVNSSLGASLGVNFDGRDGNGNTTALAMLPTETAGVVPQANWNNIPGDPMAGLTLPLVDSGGAFTAVTLDYQCSDSWNSDTATVTTPDDKLMKGIIKANPNPDTAPTGNTDKMVFTLGNLGAGPYDVIVYGLENGADGKMSVACGGTTYYIAESTTFDGTYVAATSTTPGTYELGPNYARFNGVTPTAGAIIITCTKLIENPQVNDGIGVCALQLISTSAFPANTQRVSITTQPTAQSVGAGESVSFTVAFTGPGKVQWQRNGADIPGATSATYTHVAVGSEDNSSYQAVVSNNVNSETSAAVILRVFFPQLTQGFATVERWENISSGTAVQDLYDVITAGTPPTTSFYVAGGAVPQTVPDIGSFGCRITGWLKPTVSGDYTFFIRSDDASELYLNSTAAASGTNTLPDFSTSTPIATETGCCLGFLEPDDSQANWRGQTTLTPITLQAGKLYGFTAYYKEGGGGDFFQMAWRISTDTTPAVSLTPISSDFLWTMASGVGKTAAITTQPQSVSQIQGRTATFTIAVTTTPTAGTYALQWQKDGAAIPGATSSSFTTPILALADSGTKYTVHVLTLLGPIDSDTATLTVLPDTIPPVALSAGAIKDPTSGYNIGIIFDEKLDKTLAETIGNYTITGVPVTSVNYMDSTPGVVLKVGNLTAGSSYAINIKGVKDVVGNLIVETNLNLSVPATPLNWGEVGADEMALGFGNGYAVLPAGNGGFDVYSDGIAEWAAYDEATFVYEQLTGDFDKRVRVEYQDLSSEWARAGLIVREVTNFGVDRTTQEGGAAGRYQKVHVNPQGPTLTGPGTAGNNSHELNRRISTGGATDAPTVNNNTTPLYPTAWVRLQRVGDRFSMLRSDDGVSWVHLNSTLWPNDTEPTPMPDTVYVGPEFSPENGNITDTASRGRWLAKFRDYGNAFPPAPVVAKRDYSIGLNFGSERQGGGTDPRPSDLASTDVAGAPGIKQKFWNNMPNATGSGVTGIVADKAGVSTPTTVTVTWDSPNTWTSFGDGEINDVFKGADFTLMHGYIDTGASTTTTVDVQNIPTDLTAAGYDVYVYFNGGVGPKGGGYRITDGAGNVLKDYIYARGTSLATDFYPVPDGTSPTSYGVGNYMVFKGLTAAKIRIEASTVGVLGTAAEVRGVGVNPRAPINAIQLVAPGTAPTKPIMTLQKTAGGQWQIVYTGVLQSAPAVTGTYTPVQNASSPYTVDTSTGLKFFRASSQ